MRALRKFGLTLGLLAVSGGAWAASGTQALDGWLNGLKSLRAQFTQSIKDSQGRQTDQASGELLVLRPGRFRWESHTLPAPGSSAPAAAEAGQLLVADGRNVWFYDRDLQQVQVKPADAALSATPIMLLSGGAEVRKAFDLSDGGDRDGLIWVRVKPHGAEADFRQAMLGFAAGELKQMVLEDKLGQVATLTFSRSQRNAAVTPEEVSFTPPKDADVIGTPAEMTTQAATPQFAPLWWLLGWAMVLFICYATLAPARYVPDLHVNDKLEHATAFFGMTFWFGGLVARRRYALLGVLMSAFGAAIEVAQGSMGLGRDMDIHDWIADTIGVLLAIVLLLTCVPRHYGSWLRWAERLIGR